MTKSKEQTKADAALRAIEAAEQAARVAEKGLEVAWVENWPLLQGQIKMLRWRAEFSRVVATGRPPHWKGRMATSAVIPADYDGSRLP